MPARDFVAERKALLERIQAHRNSKALLYVTGDKPNMETQIHGEVIGIFADHLDEVFPAERISLVLYTNGGSTLAAWSIVNLLRMYCDELEIIVPAKAHSAGTLMCLGADRIMMTKQATLGPIDPSLQGPLTPQIPGAPPNARAPVSVEAVKGYLEMVKSDAGITSPDALVSVVVDLAQKVHPLVLGEIFRSRAQIQYLAGHLLQNQVTDGEKKKKIIDFLCSESGSHDYTINRREAASLGLNMEKPNDEFYQLLKELQATIRDELQLGAAWNPQAVLAGGASANYACTRCLIESVAHGCHAYMTEGVLTKMQVQVQPGIHQDAVSDNRTFEGWRKR